jgi:hypothetical protein
MLYRGGAPQAVAVGEGVRNLATLVDEFAAAVAAKRDTSADVTAWLDTAAVVAAVCRSLAAGDAVSLETR